MAHPKDIHNNQYDITIVGAGPAGCMAAASLAGEYRVLLVDQSIFPRNKPCGGILLEESIQFLKQFRIPKDVFSEPAILENLVLWDLNNKIERKERRGFLNISRYKFDEWLWKMALDKCSFLPATKLIDYYPTDGSLEIILEGDKRRAINTKYLISAEGSPSYIRRKLYGMEVNMRSYIAFQEWLKPTKDNLADLFFIFDDSLTDFYSWVIPKSHLLLLGSAIPVGSNNTQQIFDRLKKQIKDKIRFAGSPEIKEAKFTFIPKSSGDIHLGNERIMLIGEAAGLISPSTGEGVSYALRSGYLCADALLRSFDDPQSLYRSSCSPLISEIEEKIKKYKVLSDSTKRLEYLQEP